MAPRDLRDASADKSKITRSKPDRIGNTLLTRPLPDDVLEQTSFQRKRLYGKQIPWFISNTPSTDPPIRRL